MSENERSAIMGQSLAALQPDFLEYPSTG